ncbi:MAG: hypothetical protein IJ284_02330 [Clostridia bacterium]|nr:hypothetical protein [Clostridia bacterium]
MDAKITKERLSRMLSYDWLKIVGLALAAILLWTLVFTTTATRITPAQQFTVINYFGNVSTVGTTVSETLNDALNDGVFSYEVIENTVVDVGGNEEYGATLMETRVSTYEGDVIFVPDIANEDTEYELNGEKRYDSYLQNLVNGYYSKMMNLDPEDPDGYFQRMEKFLNGFYNGDYKTGERDDQAIETAFLERIEKNKDKRFKKDAQIEQGIRDEIARIVKYRDALIEFYGYLDSGLVTLTKTQLLDHENNDAVKYEGIFSINLCPDKEKMPNLHTIAAYAKTVKDEAGKEQTFRSAENMNVALLDFPETEESFEYESLLYINYVIRLSKAA